MSATGMSIRIGAVSPLAVGSASPGGMSELRPFPRPLRRAIVNLPSDVSIGERSARAWVERDDRLAERGCLREPHRPRNDGPDDLVAEVITYLLDDLIRELRAGVVHHADD